MSKMKAPPSVAPAVFTVEEATDYLRISRSSLYRLFDSRAVPRTRVGGRTLVRRVDLDAFLEQSVEHYAA